MPQPTRIKAPPSFMRTTGKSTMMRHNVRNIIRWRGVLSKSPNKFCGLNATVAGFALCEHQRIGREER